MGERVARGPAEALSKGRTRPSVYPANCSCSRSSCDRGAEVAAAGGAAESTALAHGNAGTRPASEKRPARQTGARPAGSRAQPHAMGHNGSHVRSPSRCRPTRPSRPQAAAPKSHPPARTGRGLGEGQAGRSRIAQTDALAGGVPVRSDCACAHARGDCQRSRDCGAPESARGRLPLLTRSAMASRAPDRASAGWTLLAVEDVAHRSRSAQRLCQRGPPNPVANAAGLRGRGQCP